MDIDKYGDKKKMREASICETDSSDEKEELGKTMKLCRNMEGEALSKSTNFNFRRKEG